MIDPTPWIFVTAIHTDTNIKAGSDTGEGSIIITIVCTLLAFVFGILCGLVAYSCVSALLKRKVERQSISLHTDNIHYEKGTSNEEEEGAVYDEVIHHYRETGIPNVQMDLNENVAYGHI